MSNKVKQITVIGNGAWGTPAVHIFRPGRNRIHLHVSDVSLGRLSVAIMRGVSLGVVSVRPFSHGLGWVATGVDNG